MPAVLCFGAIADDLTGAVELAGMLVAGGVRTALVTGPEAIPDDAQAVVIALRSRVAPAEVAVAAFARAAAALHARGAAQLFFKYCATFDSTPRGNIGPCADVLATLRDGPVLFCPTFPEADRTVYRGHLFVGDTLVSRSPKRDDPLTPMTEPDLVQVLQAQTARRVGLLRHGVVAAGAAAISRHVLDLLGQGTRFVIADAVAEDDLRAIAAASWHWPVMTGGASVAAHYSRLWHADGLIAPAAREPAPAIAGPAAVLVGSCAGRTRAQLACFADRHPVLPLDLHAIDDAQAAVAAALAWAVPRLADGPVGITTAAAPEAVAAVQRKLGVAGGAALAERLLAGIAHGLVAHGVRRLLVAGGETSGAVVQALGITRLHVAPYRAAGIGLCRAEAPVALALCLKSGKLGPVDMFAAALADLGAPTPAA